MGPICGRQAELDETNDLARIFSSQDKQRASKKPPRPPSGAPFNWNLGAVLLEQNGLPCERRTRSLIRPWAWVFRELAVQSSLLRSGARGAPKCIRGRLCVCLQSTGS